MSPASAPRVVAVPLDRLAQPVGIVSLSSSSDRAAGVGCVVRPDTFRSSPALISLRWFVVSSSSPASRQALLVPLLRVALLPPNSSSPTTPPSGDRVSRPIVPLSAPARFSRSFVALSCPLPSSSLRARWQLLRSESKCADPRMRVTSSPWPRTQPTARWSRASRSFSRTCGACS